MRLHQDGHRQKQAPREIGQSAGRTRRTRLTCQTGPLQANPRDCDERAAESLRAILWPFHRTGQSSRRHPEPLKQFIELASVPIEIFVIELACNVAPVPLWDRRAWPVGPEDVLNLVSHGGAGRVVEQQFAGNRRQLRVREGVEAGRYAFALGAIEVRAGSPSSSQRAGSVVCVLASLRRATSSPACCEVSNSPWELTVQKRDSVAQPHGAQPDVKGGVS